MKKHIFFLIGIMAMILAYTSCMEDHISDPLDPRLIMYTETGVDATGAMFNGQLWTGVVNKDFLFGGLSMVPQMWSYSYQDSLVFGMDGSLDQEPYTSHYIEFHLGGLHIEQREDLVSLNRTHLVIDGIHHSCYVSGVTEGIPPTQVTGHIYFRKVNSETMSGTFYIKAGNEMEISYGRFDYHLSVIDLEVN